MNRWRTTAGVATAVVAGVATGLAARAVSTPTAAMGVTAIVLAVLAALAQQAIP